MTTVVSLCRHIARASCCCLGQQVDGRYPNWVMEENPRHYDASISRLQPPSKRTFVYIIISVWQIRHIGSTPIMAKMVIQILNWKMQWTRLALSWKITIRKTSRTKN